MDISASVTGQTACVTTSTMSVTVESTINQLQPETHPQIKRRHAVKEKLCMFQLTHGAQVSSQAGLTLTGSPELKPANSSTFICNNVKHA